MGNSEKMPNIWIVSTHLTVSNHKSHRHTTHLNVHEQSSCYFELGMFLNDSLNAVQNKLFLFFRLLKTNIFIKSKEHLNENQFEIAISRFRWWFIQKLFDQIVSEASILCGTAL